MAEYIYVFPILLLLILGAIQFGFIYQTKSTLNYATFVAARAGALNNGSMSAIVEGLTSGLIPLFTHSKGDRNMDALKDAWREASKQANDSKLMTIQIVNPTSAAFNAYKSLSPNGDEIPNDNLMYRPTDILGGNVSIQDANLLKVRVTYCYRMVVPVLNRLIHHLVVDTGATSATPTGNTGADLLHSESGGANKQCAGIDDEYRIPITSEAVVRMQSPFRNPGKWVGP